MSNKQFISNLSATYADVRKLDAKKINLKGKNILEYIKENTTIILDERGTKADDELDIWNSYVTKDEDGNVIINRSAKPFEHNLSIHVDGHDLTDERKIILAKTAKVIDNQVFDSDNNHLMFWQTGGLVNASYLHQAVDNNLVSHPLTTFHSDLSSLQNGQGMFYDMTNNFQSFEADLPALTNGEGMFEKCFALSNFKCSDLSNLEIGDYMFHSTHLTSFDIKLPKLKEGELMFYCTKLSEFNSELPALTNAYSMFGTCTVLSSFNSVLPNLYDGNRMFQGTHALPFFDIDMPKLTNGQYMFYTSGIKSFTSDIGSLTNGTDMFCYCQKLTSFNGNLSSLTNGDYMFDNCKLDAPSVANILHFIPQRDAKPTSTTDDGNITIGIGITNTDAAKQAFAEECYCDSWQNLLDEFDDKNWAVQWQFNGPVSYSLRNPRPSTIVYTKLEEVFMPTDENAPKPHYEYVSQDGDNFYNIHWYHESNTNNEGYDCFESLEMATLSYGVLPKE